jgi:SulP family sulfate permease
MLRHLIQRLRSVGVTVIFSGLKRQIFDVLHRAHIFNYIGKENIFATEDMAIEDIYHRLGKEGDDAILLHHHDPTVSHFDRFQARSNTKSQTP